MLTSNHSLFSVFVWPFALKAIGWETYMINACWDVIMFVFVAYFWIETKGLTLEEIDAKFDAITGSSGVNPGDIEGLKSIDGLEISCAADKLSKMDATVNTSCETRA